MRQYAYLSTYLEYKSSVKFIYLLLARLDIYEKSKLTFSTLGSYTFHSIMWINVFLDEKMR